MKKLLGIKESKKNPKVIIFKVIQKTRQFQNLKKIGSKMDF